MLGIDIQQILLHLLNFVILFTGLYVLLYGPVKKFMDKRAEDYKKMDDEAEEKLENAKKLESEYNEKISAADVEIADMKKKASVEISEARDNQMASAKEEADAIIEAAKKSAEREKEEILESDVYDAFLSGVERGAGDGAGA